jgi:hypothetical protein
MAEQRRSSREDGGDCTRFGCLQTVEELYRNLCCGREDRFSSSKADTGSRVRFGNLCSLSLSLSTSPTPLSPAISLAYTTYDLLKKNKKNFKLWKFYGVPAMSSYLKCGTRKYYGVLAVTPSRLTWKLGSSLEFLQWLPRVWNVWPGSSMDSRDDF